MAFQVFGRFKKERKEKKGSLMHLLTSTKKRDKEKKGVDLHLEDIRDMDIMDIWIWIFITLFLGL